MAGDSNAHSGIQELGTEVLSTRNSITQGLSSPLRGFRFTANFEGLGTTSFKSVQGVGGASVDESPYREGGFGHLTVRKLPGLVTYDDIQLEKGMYSNPILYNFFNDYLEGSNFTPVNAVITVYNNAGEPTASWSVINAWPKAYQAVSLSADSSEILIESLTLAHEGVKRDVSVAS